MPPVDSAQQRALLARLQSLQLAGVEQLPRPRLVEPASVSPSLSPEPAAVSAAPVEMPKKKAKAAPKLIPDADIAPGEEISTAATLEILQQEVAACTLCDELASTRTNTVFGVGDPKAKLCFMGEAPGADEDASGIPFVGRAGQLLTKIIEACNLSRDDVYILNVLKCRPPGNRNPSPAESANCKRFLRRQLDLIQPEYICCLGAVAAQNLLETTTPIGKMRGQLHDYRGVKVVCTYHPAYLLRNPAAKKDCWDDMKFLMAQMGVKL